jgi:hypothetical protein
MPKVILITSEPETPRQSRFQGPSRAALNYFIAQYTRTFSAWKINSIFPGVESKRPEQSSESENLSPTASRVRELVLEGVV